MRVQLFVVELEFLAAIFNHLLDGKLFALAYGEREIERDTIGLFRVDHGREQPVLNVLHVEIADEMNAPHVVAIVRRKTALFPLV